MISVQTAKDGIVRLLVVASVLILAACVTEFRRDQIAGGGYEFTLPYTPVTVGWESTGVHRTVLEARARVLCPSGYTLNGPEIRKRQEDIQPEYVWTVICADG